MVLSEKVNKKVKVKQMMATEQIMSEVIAKAVAEANRLAIQAMVEAWVEWMHNMAGPKIGSPTMKQPTFDWDAEDKYSELKHLN